ncbi:MAG: universal stress protein [Anaerolineae bacterium]|jgi:nucleotide-binding universal stress UspA family protein
MYKTIAVPLDGSKRAEAILPHVEQLALKYEAKVVLVRVIEPIPYVLGPEGTPLVPQELELEQRRRESEAYMAAREGVFREKGIEVSSRILQGPVVAAIIDAAESEGADLIAMASHGRSGLAQCFYGSVAAGVLNRVNRPLLLIRSLNQT